MALAVAAAALAASSTLAGIPAAHAQSSPISADVTRYAGEDRYATSLAVAQTLLVEREGALEWAVIVSGHSWPDAVVAASLAGALDAPVLLSPPDELLEETSDFLWMAEISKILVVGSPELPGISNDVVAELVSGGYTVERVVGSDRSETSVAVAERLGEILRDRSGTTASVGAMPGFGSTAIVASSEVFADALVSGPVSAYGEHPVLLTAPQHLDTDVADYLVDAGVEHVVLMGGTAALGRRVERALDDLGLDVTRLAGATRFDTAVLLAELAHERYVDAGGRACFTDTEIGLARARVPFDSFSAGPLLAHRCASLVLTDPLTTDSATQSYLDTAADTAAVSNAGALQIHVFGGQAAVSASVVRAYFGGSTPTGQQAGLSPSGCGSDHLDRIDLEVTDLIFHVSWNRDCSRMVWTNTDRELWVANGDGTEARQLPGEFSKPGWPTLSPDSTRVAFTAVVGVGSDAQWYIVVANTDGSGTVLTIPHAFATGGPSWSPDGTRLAITRSVEIPDTTSDRRMFDRFLVIVDVETGQETPLLQGGAHEVAPAWSPDGSQIAYGSGDGSHGSIWVMEADGTERRYLTAADSPRGANWSPDGTRLAAYRNLRGHGNDFGENGIVVVDLVGLGEQLLPLDDALLRERFFPNRAPQWSPDGHRLIFHNAGEYPWRYQLPAENWMQLMAAPQQASTFVTTCKPRSGTERHTVGFPLPTWARSSTGVLRVALLFVDFPDAVANRSTWTETSPSTHHIESYLETMSYGQLDVELVRHDTWLRAEHAHTHYLGDSQWGELLWQPIGEHAVELADRDGFDFSGIDVVMTIMPSSHFGGGGNEGDNVSADGNTMRSIRINHRPEGAGRPGYEPSTSVTVWGPTAAHEILHSLGLLDLRWNHLVGFILWPIGHPNAPPPVPEGDSWATVSFGSMDLNGRAQVTGLGLRDERPEMLAWSRWQLGWLDSTQVECIRGPAADVQLSPIADPGAGTAMAAVQISAHGVIVVESRRLLGFDTPSDFFYDSVAAGVLDQSYLNEGVLVYTVNTQLSDHPASLAHDDGRGNLSRFPLLDVGESVRVAGYTITVVADTGSQHRVSIRKND